MLGPRARNLFFWYFQNKNRTLKTMSRSALKALCNVPDYISDTLMILSVVYIENCSIYIVSVERVDRAIYSYGIWYANDIQEKRKEKIFWRFFFSFLIHKNILHNI